MKSTSFVLAALFSAVWVAAPVAARANEDKKKERVVVNTEVRTDRDDRDGGDEREGGGDRGGDRGGERGGERGSERGGDRRGPRGSGPGWMKDGMDAELRAKFDKVRALEGKIRDLGGKLSKAPETEKAAGKAEARKIVGELFDAKLDLDLAILTKTEKHVAEMKDKLAKRKENRERVIESRVARLTGEGDDWD